MELLNSIIGFVIAIGILVTFHEYGHFIVARLCNVKVLNSALVSEDQYIPISQKLLNGIFSLHDTIADMYKCSNPKMPMETQTI